MNHNKVIAWSLMFWVCSGGLRARCCRAADEPGLRVPPGFRVSLYADETLANDIYAMTLDARGRVVVTGRGYVKVLHDKKGAGKADSTSLFATTATGGMGLCFDGNDLYFCGDDWFSRYRDRDGDGQADGPPERLAPLKFTEHGGHAMRKGPDGNWYLVGGNDSGIGTQHAQSARSPIRHPEAGALLRFRPTGTEGEVIAHGFRNPYDFDFNAAGDLFLYDSDVERDYFLPWYSPTRIYHVGYASHHGWRLTGFQRSWARRDDYLDTVDILWPVGRGSPTGVVCYRHDQFPEHYRGGVFALDWTFGKIFFFPLDPTGSSYRSQAEVFLEPVGSSGFAPTDAEVAPDGSLFVSIGGRGTRGSVFRIEYVGEGGQPAPQRSAPGSEREAVLHAPQPLAEWSRARWVPIARRLGRDAMVAAVADQSVDPASRVRAVEVLTELFGGLKAAEAKSAAQAASPLVRARVAWSLGRVPCAGWAGVIEPLAADPDPRVRLAALDALADHADQSDYEPLMSRLSSNLADGDKRVRQAAARLASLLPEAEWKRLTHAPGTTQQARLSMALALAWRPRDEQSTDRIVDLACAVLGETGNANLRLQAVRLCMLALGDYRLQNPAVEVETGYSLQGDLRGRDDTIARVRAAIRAFFPTGHARLDDESARLLAMLEDDDRNLPAQVARFWTSESSPTRDMHFLVVFSRLRGPHGGGLTPKVAATVLGLHGKLRGQEQRNKQVWGERLAEVVSSLVQSDPPLADALLGLPEFVNPGHVPLALGLDEAHRREAAERFLGAARKDPEFSWSPALVDLLANLPRAQARPALRVQWQNLGLRDVLLLALAEPPDETDRDKFLTGLESAQPQVVQACLTALERLPRDPSAEHLVPLLRLMRQLSLERKEDTLQVQLARLIKRQAGASLAEGGGGNEKGAARYRRYEAWFGRMYPALAGALNGAANADLRAWSDVLRQVEWSKGDAARGATLFQARACQTCHTGTSRIGPDLTGVTGRLSRDDLFTAVIAPSRDVAPPYRTTVIETKDGRLLSGINIFESADGVILQTSATNTLRVPNDDIAERHTGQQSLMPDGLLQGLSGGDLADLYRYLQTLTRGEQSEGKGGK
jgi:putative membrane-bound dehydrogenase-like protein